MLADPTPCSLKTLDAWRDFWARVDRLSAAELEALAVELCRQQEKAYAPAAEIARRQLVVARAEDDLARELVRVALWLGDLVAYASYPTKAKAFAIDTKVWDVMALDYHDAHRSIEDGIFAINTKYPMNPHERELANRPLFINRGLANRWLRIKPPSSAQQRKTAKAIVKYHKDHRPMRKADFVQAAMDELIGLSRNRAMQLWRDHAPDTWRRPGTKRGN